MKSHFVSLPELPLEEQERLSELKDRLRYKMISINVKIGDKVSCNDVLASYGVFFVRTSKEVRVWSDQIKSNKTGVIKRVCITGQSRVRPGASLMVIEYCPHEMEFNGLCAFCGSDITCGAGGHDDEATGTKQQHIISGQEIGGKRKIVRLTASALSKLRIENTQHLSQRNKLALVLDIDHTFLHATRESQAKLVYKHSSFAESTHRFTLPGHRSPYYIKIRPGFREFLLDVAGAFDIHLYTMSMRKYAEEIVRWIEFEPSYRGLIRNLVTRDDVPSNKKLLHRLFPCDERMVIIIDDRIDVWPAASANVIQIHKYLFWPNDGENLNAMVNNDRSLGSTQIILECRLKVKQKEAISHSKSAFKRFICNFFTELGCYRIECESDVIYIFTHKSPDDLKLKRLSLAIKEAMDQDPKQYVWLRNCKIQYTINANELKRREGDRVLPCLSNVLLKIHSKYYENEENTNENDTRNILQIVKKDVFRGFVFVFSGCFPMDCKQEATMEWKIAKEFGAQCVQQLSVDNAEGVTHCVTPRMGTKKTAIAMKLGLECVHPNWLLNSSTHYMQSNPEIYRPSGYDEYKKSKNQTKKTIQSILKRAREKDEIDADPDPEFAAPKAKKVKFKQDIVEKFKDEMAIDRDTQLSQFVADFNQNKDLNPDNAKDIHFYNNITQETVDIETDPDPEEENFDFDDIHKDIDNAIKHLNNNDIDEISMAPDELELEAYDDDEMAPDPDPDPDDENQEIEDILNQELQSLS